MALSVVDLYKSILPRTNCKDCGFPTCLAFAGMVVSEKLPLKNCPHIAPDLLEKSQKELDEQYAAGKWLKKDMAKDALIWAKERSASMNIADLPERIGGELLKEDGNPVLKLPYFKGFVIIKSEGVFSAEDVSLNRWEQVFIYNHIAQGGKAMPTGKWKGLEEIPNTVSKMKSMKSHVEEPLIKRFQGRMEELREAAVNLGGADMSREIPSAEIVFFFRPLPKLPVMLLFWDQEEGFEAKAKLLFDETITEHLDIESIMFLSERLRQLLCET
ncbi:MAG: Fe-S cluster protein [Desulfobacteraceae bacterium IS3]|nr:MAG: Fe-S cluster protein [Desulfobacteraceae bacterium IS3]